MIACPQPDLGSFLLKTYNLFDVPDKAQARANLGVQPYNESYNYVVNGAMMISQENGQTDSIASGWYPVDMFSYVGGGISGAASVQQLSKATPGGSPYRIRATVTSAQPSIAAGGFLQFYHALEGFDVADLLFGTSAAKTVTLRFGVNAPAGTWSATFDGPPAAGRSYTAEYTISAAEAGKDVVRYITVPGDVSGAWAKDNMRGLLVHWALVSGANYQQAPGSWTAGGFCGSPNQFNFLGTVGNVFELFDVALYQGSSAPAYKVPNYQQELLKCQRQAWIWSTTAAVIRLAISYNDTAAGTQFVIPLPTMMRATPTLIVSGLTSNGGAISSASASMVGNIMAVAAAGSGFAVGASQIYSQGAGGGGFLKALARL
ncbi:hypothetical protein CWO89_21835 [Bradyrhizobium sp. Leo170]|nr:hypothetical protein CWO89_21835 [Bradyrhizobium sp. Leo170]